MARSLCDKAGGGRGRCVARTLLQAGGNRVRQRSVHRPLQGRMRVGMRVRMMMRMVAGSGRGRGAGCERRHRGTVPGAAGSVLSKTRSSSSSRPQGRNSSHVSSAGGQSCWKSHDYCAVGLHCCAALSRLGRSGWPCCMPLSMMQSRACRRKTSVGGVGRAVGPFRCIHVLAVVTFRVQADRHRQRTQVARACRPAGPPQAFRPAGTFAPRQRGHVHPACTITHAPALRPCC